MKLSDAEAAFKKAELSRKRKHQLDKKLEDEVLPLSVPACGLVLTLPPM